MKKSVLMLCALAFLVFACDKDDDERGDGSIPGNELKISVDKGSSYTQVKTVKALVDLGDERTEDGRYVWTGHVVATSEYNGGNFTLKLPESVDAQYLNSDEFKFNQSVTISNKNAKGTDLMIVGYDASGNEVGTFWYENYTNKDIEYDGYIVYVDSDVTIKGINDNAYDILTYDLTLKKGWNYEYFATTFDESDKQISTVSNKDSGGLKWVFDANDSDEMSGMKAQSVNQLRSPKRSKSLR